METLTGECAATYIHVYIANEYQLYLVFEWLTNCITKKLKRGLQPSLTQLAKSQSMYKLTRNAIHEVEQLENCRVYFTPAERLALHTAIASEILQESQRRVDLMNK